MPMSSINNSIGNAAANNPAIGAALFIGEYERHAACRAERRGRARSSDPGFSELAGGRQLACGPHPRRGLHTVGFSDLA